MEITTVLNLQGLGWRLFSPKGTIRQGEDCLLPGESGDALSNLPSNYRSRPDQDPYNPHNYAPSYPTVYGESRSQIEEAWKNDMGRGLEGPADITNSMAPEGLVPWFGREPYRPMRGDALTPFELKPPKHEIFNAELRGCPEPDVPLPAIYGNAGERVREQLQNNNLDYYNIDNQAGFAKGLEMDRVVTGGVHYGAQRLFTQPHSQKSNLEFRFGGNGPAVHEGRAVLGALRLNNKTEVREANSRVPFANAAQVCQQPRSTVVMRNAFRDETSREFVPPASSSSTTNAAPRIFVNNRRCKPARRPCPGGNELHEDVLGGERSDQLRQRNRQLPELWRRQPAAGGAPQSQQWGAYDVQGVSARATHRGFETDFSQSRPGNPESVGSGGGHDALVPACDASLEEHVRVQDISARYTAKQDLIFNSDMRPPSHTPINTSTRPIMGPVTTTRMTPDIIQEIDTSILAQLQSNPYVVPLCL